ncbi:hypothetical protein HDV01_006402 [Terramyces sp. JEL0728]|nr:hypothetical protein HDV01_006402 [Terramyces sp. JEL0728]
MSKQRRKSSIKNVLPPMRVKMTKMEEIVDEDSDSDISDFSIEGSEHNLIRGISISDPYLATPSRRISLLEMQRDIDNELSKSTGSIILETPNSRGSQRNSDRRSFIKRDSLSNAIRKAIAHDPDYERKVLMDDIPEEKKIKKKGNSGTTLSSNVFISDKGGPGRQTTRKATTDPRPASQTEETAST